MNLRELQTEVENAIKSVYDDGQNPENIIVSLQIDDKADPDHGFVMSTEDIELTYDNDCMACGCVVHGWRDTSSDKKQAPEVCPQCKSITGIKVPRNDSVYCEDCGWPDDDFGKA